MHRIDQAFDEKKSNLLNVYFTAGHPALEDTLEIAKALDESGADLIEIGLPFSDPIADGETIQISSHQALENGMTIAKLLDQLEDLRKDVKVPVLLMGYINPVLQYGFEKFCERCKEVGVDGLILPDLPIYEYEEMYADILAKNGLYNVFLITPQTSDERIRKIDELSSGFIYMVSSASTTGAKTGISDTQIDYFKRIEAMKLKNRKMIGFGISDHESFSKACDYADGAIVGSAFIKQLSVDKSPQAIRKFVQTLKSPKS